MRKIDKFYAPNDIEVLRFSIGKKNLKKYNSLTDAEKIEAIDFLNWCVLDLILFANELNPAICVICNKKTLWVHNEETKTNHCAVCGTLRRV